MRMRRLVDLPIALKVFIAPGFVLGALLLMAAVGFVNLGDSKAGIRDLSDVAFERYRLAAEANNAVESAHRALLRTLSVAANENDATRLKAKTGAVAKALEESAAAIDRLERHAAASQSDVQLKAALAAYRDATTQVLEAVIVD